MSLKKIMFSYRQKSRNKPRCLIKEKKNKYIKTRLKTIFNNNSAELLFRSNSGSRKQCIKHDHVTANSLIKRNRKIFS